MIIIKKSIILYELLLILIPNSSVFYIGSICFNNN